MAFYDNQPDKGFENIGKCFVCGNKPDAFWVGHAEVFVCRECAINVLPKLIADALTNDLTLRQLGNDFVFSKWKREKDISISFARGIECAILRKIKKEHNNH